MNLPLPESLQQRLDALGAAPVHSEQLLRNWLWGRPLAAGPRAAEDFLPKRLREGLTGLHTWLDDQARVASAHPAQDGSQRWLMALTDGQTVETVLLPRDGVCVSTQVGCAVGCTFCMTGRDGLLRQLDTMEILAQVAKARSHRTVRKVVFMGMGEPAHNLEAVLQAIDALGTWGGIGHKNLVFSTVGDRRVFERLPHERVRPALALSLHTTDPVLRRQLLPRAPRIDPAELVELGEAYARHTGYPIQYQWTLIDGVNDSDAEAQALSKLLVGKYAVMNFIPLNEVSGSPYRRPDPTRGVELVRQLRDHGVLATLRQSAGQDVEGGCGQLRARSLQRNNPDTSVVQFANAVRLD
jgi:23S rRNA (adenine2503-C2)-methyltransferase